MKASLQLNNQEQFCKDELVEHKMPDRKKLTLLHLHKLIKKKQKKKREKIPSTFIKNKLVCRKIGNYVNSIDAGVAPMGLTNRRCPPVFP